jgi:hypothetical protein
VVGAKKARLPLHFSDAGPVRYHCTYRLVLPTPAMVAAPLPACTARRWYCCPQQEGKSGSSKGSTAGAARICLRLLRLLHVHIVLLPPHSLHCDCFFFVVMPAAAVSSRSLMRLLFKTAPSMLRLPTFQWRLKATDNHLRST